MRVVFVFLLTLFVVLSAVAEIPMKSGVLIAVDGDLNWRGDFLLIGSSDPNAPVEQFQPGTCLGVPSIPLKPNGVIFFKNVGVYQCLMGFGFRRYTTTGDAYSMLRFSDGINYGSLAIPLLEVPLIHNLDTGELRGIVNEGDHAATFLIFVNTTNRPAFITVFVYDGENNLIAKEEFDDVGSGVSLTRLETPVSGGRAVVQYGQVLGPISDTELYVAAAIGPTFVGAPRIEVLK